MCDSMRESFLEKLGKAFVPRRFRPNIKRFFAKAGFRIIPYKFFGILFYIIIAITALIYIIMIYPLINNVNTLLFALITFLYWIIIPSLMAIILMFGFYFVADLRIYKKVKDMERMLPDYLDLVVANMKGGMNFEQALWAAIRPEFGVLAEEMTITSKKVLTGTDIEEAFKQLAEEYESPTLRRAFELIIGEIGVGGNIIPVIDRVVKDLRETRDLREELASTTLAYIIFISVIVMLIAPALFGLSFQLINTITRVSQLMTSSVTTTGTQAMGFFSAKKTGGVDLSAYKAFSILTLISISIFAAMITSVIRKGEVKAGIKYIPVYAIISIIIYFLFITLLSTLFVGVVPT